MSHIDSNGRQIRRAQAAAFARLKLPTTTLLAVASVAVGLAMAPDTASAQWKPNRPVEFIVPAGTGGGADQMARAIQGIVTKHNLMKQPMVVINKAGGAGGEGFLDVKASARQSAQDHHHAVEPVHHAARDRHSVQLEGSDAGRDAGARRVRAVGECRQALQDTSRTIVEALKKAPPGSMKMGGTGSKQEDQIITVAVEKATGAKFTYIPFKGGGEVAVQLVGNHVDSTVNNPIEAVAQWRGGKLRPLCVFDGKPLDYKDKIAGDMAWGDIPTCKSQGLDMEYLMLRGIFMSPKAHQGAGRLLRRAVQEGARDAGMEGADEDGAFNTTFMTGDDYAKWVAERRKAPQGV